MTRGCKQAVAVFLNFAVLIHQLSAELQQITFDSAEWVPFESVAKPERPEWTLYSGNAVVSANGEGYGGGKALKIPSNAAGETRISRAVSWDPAETTAFIDFRVKPAANPENSLSNIYSNGTQIAFQVPEGSGTGEVWVYQGNGDVGTPRQGSGSGLRAPTPFRRAAPLPAPT